MKNQYPVGATWKAVDDKKTGIVWLEKIGKGFEVWKNLSFYTSDGSGRESDWFTSKRKAIENCFVHGRFKKIK